MENQKVLIFHHSVYTYSITLYKINIHICMQVPWYIDKYTVHSSYFNKSSPAQRHSTIIHVYITRKLLFNRHRWQQCWLHKKHGHLWNPSLLFTGYGMPLQRSRMLEGLSTLLAGKICLIRVFFPMLCKSTRTGEFFPTNLAKKDVGVIRAVTYFLMVPIARAWSEDFSTFFTHNVVRRFMLRSPVY